MLSTCLLMQWVECVPYCSDCLYMSTSGLLYRDMVQQLTTRNESLENKLQQSDSDLRSAQALLLERANQIAALQREGDHKEMRIASLEDQVHSAKEHHGKTDIQLSVAKERTSSLQSEVVLLRQQLESSHRRLTERESSATQAQEKFEGNMETMRAEMDKVRRCYS